jgi:serine phosphatase RsbU (regulator of sigma subunit)
MSGMMIMTLLWLSSAAIFILLFILFYRRFPLHLIYRSKIGLQEMLDGIGDPLIVISNDYTVGRANRAYTALVGKSFADTVGRKCYVLLRNRISPCKDCLLRQSLVENKSIELERTEHPCGKGVLSITFSPFDLSRSPGESSIIEHIRDITELENLKHDLEVKNRSLAHTMKHLKDAQQNIRDELQLARHIQQGLLPTAAPATPHLKIAHTYHPVADVGGDIYDFISYPSGHLGIFIGDASGHGLSAAFVGTISKMSLYNHGKNEIAVGDLVSKINDDLISNIHTGHYLTCFWGIFSFEDSTFTFCRAGHPMPVQIKKDGAIVQLSTAGTFIGILPNSTFSHATVSFEPGDRFFLFTDGIYEVDEPDSKSKRILLGYDKFTAILAACGNIPFGKVMPHIRKQLADYTYEDDYTLIAIEVTAR